MQSQVTVVTKEVKITEEKIQVGYYGLCNRHLSLMLMTTPSPLHHCILKLTKSNHHLILHLSKVHKISLPYLILTKIMLLIQESNPGLKSKYTVIIIFRYIISLFYYQPEVFWQLPSTSIRKQTETKKFKVLIGLLFSTIFFLHISKLLQLF